MGVTLGTLQARLKAVSSVIPASSTRTLINEALREIYDENEWGFLFTNGIIRTPAIIEGTAQVTRFQNTLVVDDNIKNLINAIAIEEVNLFERQARFPASVEVDRGFTYNITDWDGVTGTLTIDPLYQDIDNLSARIQILKVYYTPPYYTPPFDPAVDPVPIDIIDFKRFEYIVSPQYNRRLILDITPEQIFKFDPYRQYSSEPRYVVSHVANQFENPQFELYPSPRFSRVLRVRYLRAGLPLIKDSETVHDILTQSLIIAKAKVKAYEYILANSELLGIKSAGKFANMMVFAQKEYENLLAGAIKKDEERYPKAYMGNVLNCPYYDDWISGGDYTFDGECLGETLVLNF